MSMQSRKIGALPPLNFQTIMLLLLSCSIATIAFDIWGQVISPGILSWASLAPVPLAIQTVDVVLGIRSKAASHFMHLFVVGLIAYPFGWVFIFRPLQERLIPKLPILISSAIYGFGLFLLAIGIVAGPLLAGNPWFLNWSGITWVAMIGHVLYGIVCAYCVRYIEKHMASSGD
ncbi:MAG: hypothetical protein AAGD96_03265 [Chloroflexota bacterium]